MNKELYRFYSWPGLGVRIAKEKVDELLAARLPRRVGKDKR